MASIVAGEFVCCILEGKDIDANRGFVDEPPSSVFRAVYD